MSTPFSSPWLEFTPQTPETFTAKTDKSASVSSDSASSDRFEHSSQPPPLALHRAGDLAEAIDTHLAVCRVCRLPMFTTDSPAPLCREGLELRRRYREARRVALGEAPKSR